MLNMALVLLLCVHDSTKEVKPFEHSLTPPPLSILSTILCCDSCSQNNASDCYLFILETLF